MEGSWEGIVRHDSGEGYGLETHNSRDQSSINVHAESGGIFPFCQLPLRRFPLGQMGN